MAQKFLFNSMGTNSTRDSLHVLVLGAFSTDTTTFLSDRIGEDSGTESAYYATDAIGSVRQIVDENGVVQFAQLRAVRRCAREHGKQREQLGFAGEWTDSTGLQYLRARYYNTDIGRFTTRDSYAGDYQYPLTLNRWMYVSGNPIMFTDPSGNFCLGPNNPTMLRR